MPNPAVSTAAKRAEALAPAIDPESDRIADEAFREAKARSDSRPIGLADQGRTVVASSTFDALKDAAEERLGELQRAWGEIGRLKARLHVSECREARLDDRIERLLAQVAETERGLAYERSEHAREKRAHRATFLELTEARDWLDGHGMCGNGDCEHVRPRGSDLCVDCDTNRDQRGV